MSDTQSEIRSFADLKEEVGDAGSDRFVVRSRGRPKTDPREAKEKLDRRKAYGAKLQKMRDAKGLTLEAAAEAAGIASARKLSQYETTCYPPGWVLKALAPVYGVEPKFLAALTVESSDPSMFSALSDDRTAEEFSEESAIDDGE
jgi:transcriptional regulator with XRE-family HTH domain